MADTWPVNNGSVGTQSSTEIGYGEGQVDPRLASAAGIGPTLGGSEPVSNVDTTDDARAARTAAASEETPEETTTVTRAGTTPSADTVPTRTAIIDPAQSDVVLAPDTFLQSLQGSLSSILNGALNNLLSSLPPVMQDLLNATGLTGALSGLVDQISSTVSQAIGSLTDSLAGAVQHIAGDIGNAITSIPGVGPVIDSFGSAVGNLTENLQAGFAGLPADLQGFVEDQVGNVGASILRAPNLHSIIPNTIQDGILRQLNFPENPVGNLDQIAGAAREMDRAFFPQTGNPIFADLGARANEAGQQLAGIIEQRGQGFGFRNVPQLATNAISQVSNGSIRISF